jgi:hypothetical protein
MAVLIENFNQHVSLEALACTQLVVAMQYISRPHFTNCVPDFYYKNKPAVKKNFLGCFQEKALFGFLYFEPLDGSS